MTLQLEPDVAFGMHPDFGVAAAVADDRPFLDEVLRKHHFTYSKYLDVYLLPVDTPHNTAVRAVASTTREFQKAGLSVAVDPKIVVLSPIPALDGVPARTAQPGQSLSELTGQLHELHRAADVSEVLGEILDKHHGVVLDLEEFIATAAAWCERLGTPMVTSWAFTCATSLITSPFSVTSSLEPSSNGRSCPMRLPRMHRPRPRCRCRTRRSGSGPRTRREHTPPWRRRPPARSTPRSITANQCRAPRTPRPTPVAPADPPLSSTFKESVPWP
ncbi:hypothetical protein [Streptomyces spiralis]|uniref:hypothetical protein n=1 Tax=Streptomyces spiralis TaxID=66376 RepID=UPI0033DF4718